MIAVQPDEKNIFNAARRLGVADARQRYLTRACGGDEVLHARVNALLRVHDEDAGFLTTPAVPYGDGFDDVADTIIGPYTLVGPLGAGGMGVVYLAEQSHPVRRQVALKVIRPGPGARHLMARFEAERRALSLMEHPNIARVLDAGTTPAGRSYFVMEVVRGVSITRYCDDQRLTPRARLELFLQVCRGVQHAHQKGVVHRDIKPSNILVTVYDGKPVPKIIDFGLAKSVDTTSANGGAGSYPGFVVGTPDYMSPEQAAASKSDVDTRSDVYSLGVLLYELLTGTTPLWRSPDRDPGLADVLARIGDEEPPRPSLRLDGSPDLTSIAADRGVEPRRLAGLVRGDLDWIVMKCLEKDRSRRYQTVDGLARDVERYLNDEPVEASPPAVGYRLRKFARRHRAALATAGGFAALLLGCVGVSGWLAARATVAERTAVAERDRTEEARRHARQALDTLTDETVERLLARQARMTDDDRAFLRRVLALHEQFAAAEADGPAGRAGVADARFRVGQMRHRLGEFRGAEEAFRGAIDFQRQLADEFPDRPDYRRDLARTHVRLAGLLRETSRPVPAEAAGTTAVTLLRDLAAGFPARPDFRRELAAAHNNLGNILSATGRPSEAEATLRAAVEALRPLTAETAAPPEDRRLLAAGYQNLGGLLLETDRLKQAEECFLNSRMLFEALVAEFPTTPDYRRDLAKRLSNLGALYVAMRRPQQAEAAFRAAAGQLQKLADEYPARPDYRSLLASSRSNLANLLTRLKRHRPAEDEYAAARAIYERLTAEYPLVAEYQSDLGKTLVGLALLKSIAKDHAAARRLIEEALPHDEAALRGEPKNPTYREAYRTHRAILAEVLGSLGDHAAAAAAADELVRAAHDPAADALTAAWIIVRCVPLAREDGGLATDERDRLAGSYADRAMAHLQSAVRHGYKDAARLGKDRAFDPLRPRDDFRALLRTIPPAGRP